MPSTSLSLSGSRASRIAQARQIVIHESGPLNDPLVEPWIVQSWQRCLKQGQRPGRAVQFEPVSQAVMRSASDENRFLVQAARPILQQLGQALASTRYFAILTNCEGVVVDTEGPIDRSDRRADLITRIGVDLSEQAVGTTAIGATLRELRSIWLHRGEHFYNDTSVYSCAGAPLLGPDGRCFGMLDLTGVEVAERPELCHLANNAAHRIENSVLQQRPHHLLLRLTWPGLALGSDADALVTLDADGSVNGANQAARKLLPSLNTLGVALHARDLFAMAWETLFDAARQERDLEVPLWSNLRVWVRAVLSRNSMISQQDQALKTISAATMKPLKEVETDLIRRAIQDARGNVALAARTLGISRATIYRKLGRTDP